MRKRIEEILDEYQEQVLSDPGPKTGTWIFRVIPKQDTYIQAILDLIEEETNRVRVEMNQNFIEASEYSCTCRCRGHGVAACPYCLAVERCYVHSEPDVESLEKG